MNNLISQIKQRFALANIAERIIYINVAVFILGYVFKAVSFLAKQNNNIFNNWFALPSQLDKLLYRPWSIVSYGFLHGGFWHILFNMLLLYYIGRLFLDFFSRNQFLTYYFTGIIAGGLLFLASYNLFPALKNSNTILVGASAGVTAIIIGLATKIPNYALRFRFIGSIKMWHIAVAFIVIDIIQIPVSNTGGHLAHLGGALAGFLLTNNFKDAKGLSNFFTNLFTKKEKKSPLKTVHKKKTITTTKSYSLNKTDEQQKIDEILDKISKSGYNSLSQVEKDFLFSVGKK